MSDRPPDPVLARMADRLPVNRPYDGVLAEQYDVCIPVDEPLPEERVLLRLLADVDGTVLEIGCGTGRPLLRWLAGGIDVEGLDASADMLAILRRHAAERGLDPTLHHGNFVPLTLGRRYAAIVCPAGTFTLVGDDARARVALASFRDHLEPGGLLAITLFVPADDFDEHFDWRLRRTGTNEAGTTFVVDEAIRCDRAAQLQVLFNRLQTYDASGRLVATELRRYHLRWWTREEFGGLLADAGFVGVEAPGGDDGWVAVGRREA